MASERSIPHLRDIFGLSINHKQPDAVYNHQSNNGDIDKPSKKSKKSSKTSASQNGGGGGGELKTLERHLSMKKTIRKKIMRDLQQAFVDDPNEFKVDNNQERMKAELNLEAMRYGESKHRSRKSDNFLDMLRGDQLNGTGAPNYNHNNNNNLNNSHLGLSQSHQPQQPPPSQPYRRQDHNMMEENYNATIHPSVGEKQSFWSRFGIRNKNKR